MEHDMPNLKLFLLFWFSLGFVLSLSLCLYVHIFYNYSSFNDDVMEFSWGVLLMLIVYIWVWVNTYRYIFSGMNIHLPAILGFTRYQGFDPSPYVYMGYDMDFIWASFIDSQDAVPAVPAREVRVGFSQE